MSRKARLSLRAAAAVIVVAAVLVGLVAYLRTVNIQVLNPKGTIALEEFHLIVFAAALSLLVVVPVYVVAIAFAVRYREGRGHATYDPTLEGNTKVELVWWGVPTLLIVVLSVVTWVSSQTLDPYRSLGASAPTTTVQVVALDWKWLFIYPDEHIASVNRLVIPVGAPVRLLITSDAPMNSLWIPQLAGQIYAMPGMQTQLNLKATALGSFTGLSANISGAGFSTMNFQAVSVSAAGFQAWVERARGSAQHLDAASYASLAQPSSNAPVSYYVDDDAQLFETIVGSYHQGSSAAVGMTAAVAGGGRAGPAREAAR
jgi:cytochrome o ubiquinol oxidase subunit 2